MQEIANVMSNIPNGTILNDFRNDLMGINFYLIYSNKTKFLCPSRILFIY